MKISNVICSVVTTLFVASILTLVVPTGIASADDPPRKACKGHHKDDMNCNGGGGGGGVPGTFIVTLSIKVGETFMEAGSAVNVVGDTESDEGHHRAGVGATDMNVNLDHLDTAQRSTTQLNCPLLGAVDGRFGISTARHEEDGPITFVAVSLSGFKAGG